MNIEIVRGSLTNRGHVVAKSQVKLEPCAEELYFSLFGFDHTIFEHLEINKTVSGFQGAYFADFLFFDIDRDGDLPGSVESARDLVRRLYNRFQLSPKQLVLYFSGNKGFHIGLHQSLFGGFAPGPNLPQQIQVLCARLVAEAHGLDLAALQTKEVECKKTGGHFGDIDFGIYNPNRIFRAPNSLNAKSGRYKIPLLSTELLDGTLEQILALAAAPRVDFVPEARITSQAVNADLAAMWAYARDFDVAAFGAATLGGRHKGEPIDRDFFAPPAPGNRNNDLFKQACHLFDHSTLYESHVLQLIESINQAGADPLPADEVRTIVRSAFKRTGGGGKKAQAETEAAPASGELARPELWQDWTEEWLEYYTQEPTPMTCGLPAIDEDQEHNLKGKLAVFIGSGGTRKSYFAQNVIAQNVLGYGCRFIYSSMEMGKPEVVNRLLDMAVDPVDAQAASKHLQAWARADKPGAREYLRQAAAVMADNLVLCNNSGKTPADYEKLIQDTMRLYGPVDGLVIDGLSAMGGKGEETERYSRHTLDLKELAKRYNIFIALICHTTKACAAHTRDARPFVRGSEKILDNSDFSVCFANIIDAPRSTPDNIYYANHLAHIKYYNKRGSGKMLNQLMEFTGLTKTFSPSPAPLIEYPDFDTFSREYAAQRRKSERQNGDF
jgi:hypothetical protein